MMIEKNKMKDRILQLEKENESLKFTISKLNAIAMDMLKGPEAYFPKLSKTKVI